MRIIRIILCVVLFVAVVVSSRSSVALAGGSLQASAPSAPDNADATVGTVFTYQGNLKKSGQPVNADCNFQFSLWGDQSGGAQIGATRTISNATVQTGLFTVELDFGNQFSGEPRWLQTAVQCAGESGYTDLNPRQPLNAVPYALGLRPGAMMESATPGDAFYVENNAADSNAVHGKATEDHGTGVLGESESWAGVWGQSTEASGVVGTSAGEFSGGVYGVNTGKGYGVYGKADNGAGVWGNSTAWIGVYGSSSDQTGVVGESSNHDGVRGTTTATNQVGVRGVANADGAVGVWGESAANTGVYGTSTTGIGVWGQTTNANTVAVKGVANADGAVGVWGESAANTGVYGQSGATAGAALWGNNTAGGVAVRANGSAIQSRDKGGFAKAMLHVTRSGTISHCYNGINGASTGDCGVTIAHTVEGRYDITFDFIVADRFIQVTPEYGTTGDGSIVMLLARTGINSNRIVQVFSYHPPPERDYWGDSRKDTGFWLTIY
ncbi:MAG: hypothetical protein KDD83_21350 [Caldilineaceae bacterium]|nr:hypothetical protein [Caldilineaceae bacterium]